MSFNNTNIFCGFGRILTTSFLGLAFFLTGCDSCEDGECDDDHILVADEGVDCFVADDGAIRPCTEDDDVSLIELPTEDITLPPVAKTEWHCYNVDDCRTVKEQCAPGVYTEETTYDADGSVTSIHGVCKKG